MALGDVSAQVSLLERPRGAYMAVTGVKSLFGPSPHPEIMFALCLEQGLSVFDVWS